MYIRELKTLHYGIKPLKNIIDDYFYVDYYSGGTLEQLESKVDKLVVAVSRLLEVQLMEAPAKDINYILDSGEYYKDFLDEDDEE